MLQPSSIRNFKDLAKLFIMKFMASKKRRRPIVYILIMKQRDNDSLKMYLAQFNKECLITSYWVEKLLSLPS